MTHVRTVLAVGMVLAVTTAVATIPLPVSGATGYSEMGMNDSDVEPDGIHPHDVNNDGVLTPADVVLLFNKIVNDEELLDRWDMNEDGDVGIADVVLMFIETKPTQ